VDEKTTFNICPKTISRQNEKDSEKSIEGTKGKEEEEKQLCQ